MDSSPTTPTDKVTVSGPGPHTAAVIGQTHTTLAPGFSLMAAAVVSLVAVLCARETSRTPLRES